MALPTVHAAAAHQVIDALAEQHPDHQHPIRALGRWLLGRASRGMRDGTTAGRTYDLSFVGDRGSFACITARLDSQWNPVAERKLRIEGRFDGDPHLLVFHRKPTPDGQKGWHYAHVQPGDCLDSVLRDLESTRR